MGGAIPPFKIKIMKKELIEGILFMILLTVFTWLSLTISSFL